MIFCSIITLLLAPMFSAAQETAVIAMLAIDGKGVTISERNSGYPMVPASTMKTVTTALALGLLGEDFRFSTSIAADGRIDSLGTLHGDLYIIGGADPTLASTRSAQDSTFRIWTEAIRKAGIDSIAGAIIGDDRFFPEEAAVSSWEWGDLGTYYGAGASGLSFHENYISLRITSSGQEGRSPSVEQLYPETPWMYMDNFAVTGPKWSKNTVGLFTSEISPVSEIRGSYPVNGGTTVEKCCNKYPAMTCAYHFDKYLRANGINSLYGAMDTRRLTARDRNSFAPADSLKPIVTTASAPLSEIVGTTNRESNNLYAETLFRMIGKTIYGDASYEASAKAALRMIKEMGIDTGGYRQVDGSGLSRQNLASPAFLCRFLLAAAHSHYGRAFIESLPVPGHEGTLKYLLKDMRAELTSGIRAKSGSMSGVKCYAGYILGDNPEELTVFAIMSNNHIGESKDMQDIIEDMLGELL